VVRPREPFKFWKKPTISVEGLKPESSNFANRFITKVLAFDGKAPLKGAWSGSCDPFKKIAPNHIFGNGEARHFKICVLID